MVVTFAKVLCKSENQNGLLFTSLMFSYLLPLAHDTGGTQHRLSGLGQAMHSAVYTQLVCRLWIDTSRALH